MNILILSLLFGHRHTLMSSFTHADARMCAHCFAFGILA